MLSRSTVMIAVDGSRQKLVESPIPFVYCTLRGGQLDTLRGSSSSFACMLLLDLDQEGLPTWPSWIFILSRILHFPVFSLTPSPMSIFQLVHLRNCTISSIECILGHVLLHLPLCLFSSIVLFSLTWSICYFPRAPFSSCILYWVVCLLLGPFSLFFGMVHVTRCLLCLFVVLERVLRQPFLQCFDGPLKFFRCEVESAGMFCTSGNVEPPSIRPLEAARRDVPLERFGHVRQMKRETHFFLLSLHTAASRPSGRRAVSLVTRQTSSSRSWSSSSPLTRLDVKWAFPQSWRSLRKASRHPIINQQFVDYIINQLSPRKFAPFYHSAPTLGGTFST